MIVGFYEEQEIGLSFIHNRWSTNEIPVTIVDTATKQEFDDYVLENYGFLPTEFDKHPKWYYKVKRTNYV